MNSLDINVELSYVRNVFSRSKFGNEEMQRLLLIKTISNSNQGPFADLIEECINNCLADIERGDSKSAALEIHFIHNLPIKNVDIKKWDEDHFYSIEVRSYFELTERCDRVKSYISKIAKSQERITMCGISPRKEVLIKAY